ncbi:uncharacterized protein [Cardiocondyla obscurior]|uniref:uncharacterized protein n=1 Tax=Cardiocondyla obscurior TaxID=286306 RepID=UPI00396575C5
MIDTSTPEIFEALNEAEILPMSSNNVHLEINDHLNVNSTELKNIDNEKTLMESNLLAESVAQFFLKLESQYLVPATTIQYIITEVSRMHDETQDILRNKLTKKFAVQGISEQLIHSIVKETFNSDLIKNTNMKLSTNYKRKMLYKNKFDYVTPVQIVIDEQKKTSFAYVSIIETLRKCFKDNSLHNELKHQEGSRKKDLLEDFTGGNVFLNNIFFQQNPDALRIILYQDAFEIVNPIGAAKKKHKLQGIYMSLGNIPHYLRCHVNSIKLVALCKESDFEHETVYGKIVTDIKKLEKEGTEIDGKNIKGSLVCIIGDNLGSHELGGFVQNFSTSQYFCRFCLITRNDFNEEDGAYKTYAARTIESYNNGINLLKDNNMYQGIKFNSVFNEL